MSEGPSLGRKAVVDLLDADGLSPKKSLGQNFVVDPNTIDRIVRLSGVGATDHVVEVGAGLGSLTFALERTGAKVVAYEIDQQLARLVDQQSGSSILVINHDVLTADISSDLASAATDHFGELDAEVRWHLVANLPYNIATPLVMKVLEAVPVIDRLLVMVQKEVADRIVSGPSVKDYGSVSVRIAYFANARIVGRVARQVFFPQPHVDSALVEITRRPEVAVDPSVCSYGELSLLVRTGFAQRRKMLRRSLAGVVDEQAFVRAEVDSALRAENLDVLAWGKLAACQRAISSSPEPS